MCLANTNAGGVKKIACALDILTAARIVLRDGSLLWQGINIASFTKFFVITFG